MLTSPPPSPPPIPRYQQVVDEDDQFSFIDLQVERDPAEHPDPEDPKDVMTFLVHKQAGCSVCSPKTTWLGVNDNAEQE